MTVGLVGGGGGGDGARAKDCPIMYEEPEIKLTTKTITKSK